ncbi:hypothetical protein AB1N83_013489, partial [Pleurotus pulmonarius]
MNHINFVCVEKESISSSDEPEVGTSPPPLQPSRFYQPLMPQSQRTAQVLVFIIMANIHQGPSRNSQLVRRAHAFSAAMPTERHAISADLSHVTAGHSYLPVLQFSLRCVVVSDVELGRLALMRRICVYKAEAPFINPPYPLIPDHSSEPASLYPVYDLRPFKMMWDLSGSRAHHRDRDRSIPSFPVPQPNNSQPDMRGYIPQLSPPTVPIQGPSGMSTYHRSTAEQQIQTYGRQQVIYTQGAQVVTVIQKSKHHHHKHHHSKHHQSSTPRPPILIQHSSPAAPQLNQMYPTAPVLSLPYAQPQSYSQPNLPQSAHHPQPHIIQSNYITPDYQQADGQPFDTNHSPY